MFNCEIAKKLIDESVFKREHIALELGVQTKTLTNYLNGHGRPSEDFIKTMAAFFNISPDLLTGKAKAG